MADIDLTLAPPPGREAFGEGSRQETHRKEFEAALANAGPMEAASLAPPGMPSQWQPLADWLSQPSPSFGGDAHAIHFYLNHTDGIGYQGFVSFRPATPPFHWSARNRFYGVGHVYPNVPWGELYKSHGPHAPERMPAPWVRLVIALKSTHGTAGLTFHEAAGSGALPGPQVGWGEEDVRELLGNSPHFVTSMGPWILYLELTTLMLSS